MIDPGLTVAVFSLPVGVAPKVTELSRKVLGDFRPGEYWM